jgi:hypothetical protein
MGLIDLPEVCDYFPDDVHVCPIVRQLPFDNPKKLDNIYISVTTKTDKDQKMKITPISL